MSGSAQAAPTQTTSTALGPEAQEVFRLALPGVRDFAAQTPERYQGQTVAPFDPSQVAGQEAALGAAQGQAGLASAGAQATTNWLSPTALDPTKNPGFQGTIDAATRPITEQLTRSVLPNIRSGSVSNGTFGGSRQGIAEGIAASGAANATGDATSKIVSDAYAQNVKGQLAALGLLPQTEQALLGSATTMAGVGDVRQGQAQRENDAAAQAFNFDQYAPFLRSKEILSLIQGMPGATTTSTGSVPPAVSPGMRALGGAATGAAVGSAFGPIGTGVGAAGGAVLPFLFN